MQRNVLFRWTMKLAYMYFRFTVIVNDFNICEVHLPQLAIWLCEATWHGLLLYLVLFLLSLWIFMESKVCFLLISFHSANLHINTLEFCNMSGCTAGWLKQTVCSLAVDKKYSLKFDWYFTTLSQSEIYLHSCIYMCMCS